MPYKSRQQEKWAHTKEGTKALGGKANVHEWDEATKGKKLPEKVAKSLPNPESPSNNFNTVGSQMNSQYFNKPTKNVALKGKQSVTAKAPKLKSGPDPFASPSKFFSKAEDFEGPKHPSVRKLWDFLNNRTKSK